nr:probable ascorbate-specific transmembrane electron transporter 1 [Ipomoea trifida]
MAKQSSSSFKAASALPATVLAHLLFVAIFTMVLVWLLHFREGLALRSPNKPKIFNVHPLLMVIGLILVSGQAIMAYATVPSSTKRQKVVHMILHLIALLFGIVGVYAVFKFHHEAKIPHVYTLHSWIGISTISLFGIQWVLSFLTFMFPKARSSTRAKIAPWHALLGIIIFSMATIAALTGLTEKFIFLRLTNHSQEGLVINFTGLLILLYGISVALTALLPAA